uniref:Uncharacterized protein n=1 Tax=Eptatretus burgeri TaxID=7764 RepID=A0A8C4QL75_EPTBU
MHRPLFPHLLIILVLCATNLTAFPTQELVTSDVTENATVKGEVRGAFEDHMLNEQEEEEVTSQFTKGGSAGLVVGIVVLLMMLAAGTGGGLVVYQKRLLCFRKTGEDGEKKENTKEGDDGTVSDGPNATSALLTTSPAAGEGGEGEAEKAINNTEASAPVSTAATTVSPTAAAITTTETTTNGNATTEATSTNTTTPTANSTSSPTTGIATTAGVTMTTTVGSPSNAVTTPILTQNPTPAPEAPVEPPSPDATTVKVTTPEVNKEADKVGSPEAKVAGVGNS